MDRSRKGAWVIKLNTAKSRLSGTLKRANEWLRRVRHQRVKHQHASLVRKLVGHYAYFGITGNLRRLERLRLGVRKIWRKWLGRRSQRGYMSWENFVQLEKRYPLPSPRIVHQWTVATRWHEEPYALIGHVRI